MKPELYREVLEVQQSHWWFQARRSFFNVLLRKAPSGRVLDLGCGPGSMLSYLTAHGQVIGLDVSHAALSMARTHSTAPLVQGDGNSLPFAENSFQLVTVCELLYHEAIGDVQASINECARVLAPGGALLVVDSAYPSLYSDHDRAAHGARRFTRSQMIGYFQSADLRVIHGTYAYAALLPVVWIVRRLKSLLKSKGPATSELTPTAPWLNWLLWKWFSLEGEWSGRFGLPFGLSVQVYGTKEGTSHADRTV